MCDGSERTWTSDIAITLKIIIFSPSKIKNFIFTSLILALVVAALLATTGGELSIVVMKADWTDEFKVVREDQIILIQ